MPINDIFREFGLDTENYDDDEEIIYLHPKLRSHVVDVNEPLMFTPAKVHKKLEKRFYSFV